MHGDQPLAPCPPHPCAPCITLYPLQGMSRKPYAVSAPPASARAMTFPRSWGRQGCQGVQRRRQEQAETGAVGSPITWWGRQGCWAVRQRHQAGTAAAGAGRRSLATTTTSMRTRMSSTRVARGAGAVVTSSSTTGSAEAQEAATESTMLPTTGGVLSAGAVESAEKLLILVLRLAPSSLGLLRRSPMPVAGMAQGPWTATQQQVAAMLQLEAAGEARVVTAATLMPGAVVLPLTPGTALMHAGAALMHVTAALMHAGAALMPLTAAWAPVKATSRAAWVPGVGTLQKEVAMAKIAVAALMPGAVTVTAACGWLRGQQCRGQWERSIAVAMGG